MLQGGAGWEGRGRMEGETEAGGRKERREGGRLVCAGWEARGKGEGKGVRL